ncbi:MAG: glycosyltransferase family 2 protein [Anaerolineales bacterium]|nr:glycosyltransferase family 2 protein [Anaerolineales bacterium]
MKEQTTIIIPAHNEAESIASVLQDIHKVFADIPYQVIVIDDGSNDDTGTVAAENGAVVIRNSVNKGYGASLKMGIRNATTELVLIMDADGQHQADDAKRILEKSQGRDMVVGQRTGLVHSPLWRMPGKWALGWLANYLSRRRIPDLNSGLRVFRRDVVLKYLHICPSGFSLSTTITMVLFSRGYDIAYEPINVKKRVGKSTVTISTGLDTLILMLRIASLIDPLRVFLPASLVIGLIGLGWGIRYALIGNGVSGGSLLAIVTALLLFSIGLVCDQISQLRLERYE